VLAQELCLVDVLRPEVDAVDMTCAPVGHVEAEEAAVAPDVEHGAVAQRVAEQGRDRAVDQVAAEQQAIGRGARHFGVAHRRHTVAERERHRPRTERLDARP
jgi:hypothetical protein